MALWLSPAFVFEFPIATKLAGAVLRKYDQYKIALAIASSGIAATLLNGGQTAHSAFQLSLDILGMPPHNLRLKIGSLVSLMRNLNQPRLRNGTRLVIKELPGIFLKKPFFFVKLKGSFCCHVFNCYPQNLQYHSKGFDSQFVWLLR
ncbi:hypothetical protein TNCV_2009541 [Trichonephila clavipes]|nr:hypothetical protein TNCV_2009541 [Trichonephila clavipes]